MPSRARVATAKCPVICCVVIAAACSSHNSGIDNAADSLAMVTPVKVDTVRANGRQPRELALVREMEIGGATDTNATNWIAGLRVLSVAPDGRVAINARRRFRIFDSIGSNLWFTIPDEYRPGQMRNAMGLTFKPKDGSVPRPNSWVGYITGKSPGAPGQLSDAHSIMFAGDTIAVMDLATGLQFFSREGRSLAILPIVPPPDSNRLGLTRVTSMGPTPHGWIAVFRSKTKYEGDDYESAREKLDLYRVSSRTGGLGSKLAFHWQDSAVHVAVPHVELNRRFVRGRATSDGATMERSTSQMRDPFAPEQKHVVANGLVYFARGDDFRIDVYDGYGRHTQTVIVDTERLPITDSVRNRRFVVASMREVQDTSPESKGLRDSVVKAKERMPIARFWNVVGDLFVSSRGDIAIRRLDHEITSSGLDAAVFDIVAASGEFRGRVRIPDGLTVWQFTGDAFWCSEKIGELPPSARQRGLFEPPVAVPVQKIVKLAIR